jgi:hypothetical protein
MFWKHLWSSIAFWCRSSNAHGVHSPFVYDWLTKGMKKQPSEPKSDTYLRVLYRNVRYFKPTKIGVLGSATFISSLPVDDQKINVIEFPEKELFDMIIIEKIECKFQFDAVLPLMHENSVLLIREIPSELKNEFRTDARIHVSIDCKDWQIFFKRPNQVKQHFTLRIK